MALAQEQNLWQDGDLQALIATWREGLLEESPGLFDQVLASAADAKVDLTAQQLRHLIRQCSQVR